MDRSTFRLAREWRTDICLTSEIPFVDRQRRARQSSGVQDVVIDRQESGNDIPSSFPTSSYVLPHQFQRPHHLPFTHNRLQSSLNLSDHASRAETQIHFRRRNQTLSFHPTRLSVQNQVRRFSYQESGSQMDEGRQDEYLERSFGNELSGLGSHVKEV